MAVHAHGPESVARAVKAGCNSVEHGALIDQATLDLMAAHGTYFDPNTDLVFRNYFENQSHFLGIGSYTEAGFDPDRDIKVILPPAEGQDAADLFGAARHG